MSAQVLGFETGLMSSGVLTYTLARLSCGHTGAVQVKPYLGKCMKCATEMELLPAGKATICACGISAFTITHSPSADREADRVTKIGVAAEHYARFLAERERAA